MHKRESGAIGKDRFLRNAATILSGTAFAQALAVFSLPFLTRIYSPSDFSIFAAYSSLVAILSSISCLRFEVALATPKEDCEVYSLLVLALVSNAAISILTPIVLSLISSFVPALSAQLNAEMLSLVALGVFGLGALNALQYWLLRMQRYKPVAYSKVLQATAAFSVQAAVGIQYPFSLGLIYGQVIGSAVAPLVLAGAAKNILAKLKELVSLGSLFQAFKKYKNYPKYSAPEALINTAGIQLPILLVALYGEKAEAGFLVLAVKLAQAPLALIGGAAAQAFISEAAERKRKDQLQAFTLQVLHSVGKTAIGPVFFLAIISIDLVPYVFGASWARVGELVLWMSPWLVFQLLASPISMVMHVTGRQRAMMYLTGFGLLIRAAGILFAVVFSAGMLSEAFAVSSAIYYGVCLCMFISTAGVSLKQAIALSSTLVKLAVMWISLGVATGYLVRVVLS